MNILFIKHFFVGFMVSEIPRVSVFGYFPLYAMMGTDPFLWIGIGISDPYYFPDPNPPFVIRPFADPYPDPLFLTRSCPSLYPPIYPPIYYDVRINYHVLRRSSAA